MPADVKGTSALVELRLVKAHDLDLPPAWQNDSMY
jgi:hypothetical protein